MRETAPWDSFRLGCPECASLLEPTDEGHDDPASGAVICLGCETEFDLTAIPRGRQAGGGCPECFGDLAVVDDWTLRCIDCGRRWAIRERSWLAPVE